MTSYFYGYGQNAATLPVNTSPPSISGSTAVGSTLTVTPGTWTGSPAPTLTYLWTHGDGSPAAGPATGSTYSVTIDDFGYTMKVTETATNAAGAPTATSSATGAVTMANLLGLYSSRRSTLYQDTAGTIPVTAHRDPVRKITDLSGNGNHLTVPAGWNECRRETFVCDGIRVIPNAAIRIPSSVVVDPAQMTVVMRVAVSSVQLDSCMFEAGYTRFVAGNSYQYPPYYSSLHRTNLSQVIFAPHLTPSNSSGAITLVYRTNTGASSNLDIRMTGTKNDFTTYALGSPGTATASQDMTYGGDNLNFGKMIGDIDYDIGGPAQPTPMLLMEFAIFNRRITDAECLSIETIWNSLAPTTRYDNQPLVVVDGNSIPASDIPWYWPSQASDALRTPKSPYSLVNAINLAIQGLNTRNQNASFAQRVAPLYAASRGTNHYLIMQEYTNDIYPGVGNQTAAQARQNMIDYCTTAAAAGFTHIAVLGCIYNKNVSDAGGEAIRTALNALVEADFPTTVNAGARLYSGGSYAEYFVDCGNQADIYVGKTNCSEVGQPGETYYSDGSHLSHIGHSYLYTTYIAPLLQQWGLLA